MSTLCLLFSEYYVYYGNFGRHTYTEETNLDIIHYSEIMIVNMLLLFTVFTYLCERFFWGVTHYSLALYTNAPSSPPRMKLVI